MQMTEWLSRLIAIDTVSRHSNLKIIELIESWLSHHAVSTRLTYDAAKEKANLFATIPAANGATSGGIMLSGHTDVVPVDGQDWQTNPFEATEKDNKIFGRGASDMKGFLAVVLTLIPEFKKLQLTHPVHFAFSYDEEIGCRGVPLLIEDMLTVGIQPTYCIVGEPTMMQVVVAHKGIQVFHCAVHGKAAHSSLTTEGCNAIDYAAQFITFIRELAHEYRINGLQDNDFDVPFTTLSTNKINGGNAYNIIPELCEFNFECRDLPNTNRDELQWKINSFIRDTLLPAMQKEFSQATIDCNQLASAPSFISTSSDFVREVQTLLKQNTTQKVSYATEAGLFQKANIQTIVCGPGSIKQAHKANEFIALEQLQKCATFLRKMVEKMV